MSDDDDGELAPDRLRFSFEKMISGMYLGEIVRLIIIDLVHQNLLFLRQGDHYSNYKIPLFARGGFYAKFVSTVETGEGIAFANTRRVLEDIGIRNPTYDDCAIVQHICKTVSKRASKLAAAGRSLVSIGSSSNVALAPLGLAVLINRINKPTVTVGVDGSVYRYHPRFKRNMEKCLRTLVNRNTKVSRSQCFRSTEISSFFNVSVSPATRR